MEWLQKVLFPMRRAILDLATRIRIRKSGGGLLKLQNDVQRCSYEDVQVMWEMLKKTESPSCEKRGRSLWRLWTWTGRTASLGQVQRSNWNERSPFVPWRPVNLSIVSHGSHKLLYIYIYKYTRFLHPSCSSDLRAYPGLLGEGMMYIVIWDMRQALCIYKYIYVLRILKECLFEQSKCWRGVEGEMEKRNLMEVNASWRTRAHKLWGDLEAGNKTLILCIGSMDFSQIKMSSFLFWTASIEWQELMAIQLDYKLISVVSVCLQLWSLVKQIFHYQGT